MLYVIEFQNREGETEDYSAPLRFSHGSLPCLMVWCLCFLSLSILDSLCRPLMQA